MSLTDKIDEQDARLATIRASETEFIEGPDAALQILGPPTDPIRMHATLGILIRAERHQAAADIIRDQRPAEKWLDLAALVFAYLEDIERAKSYLERADDSPDPLVMRRTRLALAEGVFECWRKRHGDQSFLAIRKWPDPDVELAKTLFEVLDPVLSLVRANRRIQGDLELNSVIYAVYLAHVMGNESTRLQYAGWLVRHTPLPLIVAELCLRDMVACHGELPNRLRVEHPGDFQAAYLAALMERELLDRAPDAFDALVHLASIAASDEEKETVCVALFETCGHCEPEKITPAIEVMTHLRPQDSRLLNLLQTAQHMAAGDIPKARRQLDTLRNETDSVWWQTHAQLCEREGDEEAAQKAWEKASELLPHPDVVRRSVQASLNRRKLESAVRGLTRLLEVSPDSQKDLHAIAWALVQLGDCPRATEYLTRLVALDPSNAEHSVWLAQCLARSARTKKAIKVLQPVCDSEDQPIEALFLESELLEADGRAVDAFHLLEPIAGDHWDDPIFLLMYMRHGHAAGEDRLAHEAFARLIELRRGGKVPPGLIQEGTLEQLLEYGKEYQSRRESLQSAVINGRVPWLLVEDILGNPPLWAWKLHTQTLAWHFEEPLSWRLSPA